MAADALLQLVSCEKDDARAASRANAESYYGRSR